MEVRELHDVKRDSTGMYPLLDKINVPAVLLRSILPSIAIYLISFFMSYILIGSLDFPQEFLAIFTTIFSLLAVIVYILLLERETLKELKRAYLTQYESGRRLMIAIGVSVIAAVMFVYYVHISWEILNLVFTQIVLAFALIFGNIVLLILTYELASYIFFGLLTFLVNMFTFSLVNAFVELSFLAEFEWSWLLTQTISFIVALLFAFYTNRQYVFLEKSDSIWKDLWNFTSGRILSTLVIENGAIFILYNLMSLDLEFAKFVGAILVTIANYFISKLFVFKK